VTGHFDSLSIIGPSGDSSWRGSSHSQHDRSILCEEPQSSIIARQPGKCLIKVVVSMGRRNTQLEPTLY
jgi:hypothetical protein